MYYSSNIVHSNNTLKVHLSIQLFANCLNDQMSALTQIYIKFPLQYKFQGILKTDDIW